MNPSELLLLLGEVLAKSVVVLVAALLVNHVWRRASAAKHHLIWFAAIATILILPLTRLAPPRWVPPVVRVKVAPLAAEPVANLPTVGAPPVIATSNPPASPKRWRWPDWRTSIVMVWTAGAALLIARRLFGSVCLVWLRSVSRRVEDGEIQARAEVVFREFGIRRKVVLRLCPESSVPVTWGTWRPVVLLPDEARKWPEAQLIAALRHEAGHIARNDHGARWLADLACALYWPNPLVWFAARRMRAAQEEATDDLVLRAGTAPDEYAAQLFDLIRTLTVRNRFTRSAVAMASPSTLERRLLSIVDGDRDRRSVSGRGLLAAAFAVIAVLATATAARLQAQETKEASGSAATKPSSRVDIEIEARFFELEDGPIADPWISNLLGTGKGELAGVLSREQYAQFQEGLAKRSEAKLLSAPRVTTRSGNRAVIEITRECRYPKTWKKEDGLWVPDEFVTTNAGVTLDVEAAASPEGVVDLATTPSVVELIGFSDVDTGTPYPVDPKGANALFRAPEVLGGQAQFTPELAEAPRAISGADFVSPVPKGHRSLPIFSERKVTTAVSIYSGQTIVLSGLPEAGENQQFPRKKPAKRMLIFVTAEIQPEPIWEKAGAIVIPEVSFRDTPLSEALEQLRRLALESDSSFQLANRGVNIVLATDAAWASPGKLTADFRNAPLSKILLEVAARQNLKVEVQPSALVLRSQGAVKVTFELGGSNSPADEQMIRALLPKNDPSVELHSIRSTGLYEVHVYDRDAQVAANRANELASILESRLAAAPGKRFKLWERAKRIGSTP